MNLRPSRHARGLPGLVVWPGLLMCLWLGAASPAAPGAAQRAEPNGVTQAAVATPDVWFTVTPTSEYGKVSSFCTTPCLTVTFTAQYHYAAPPCDFGVNLYWDKIQAAGGGRVGGSDCTTPKIKRLQIDGVTYGTHQICAIPYPPGVSNPIVKCVTFHVLKPAPKATATPKRPPKPTPTPTPTASPSPSPMPTEVATPTATAIAAVATTPTPAPAPPTTPGASPTLNLAGAGGASLDLSPVFVGGAIFLVVRAGMVVAMVRRARVLPPR